MSKNFIYYLKVYLVYIESSFEVLISPVTYALISGNSERKKIIILYLDEKEILCITLIVI